VTYRSVYIILSCCIQVLRAHKSTRSCLLRVYRALHQLLDPSTVFCLLFGQAYPPRTVKEGRPRALSPAQEQVRVYPLKSAGLHHLQSYLDDRPTAYLDETTWYIFDVCEVIVSDPTIWCILSREEVYHISVVSMSLPNRMSHYGMTGRLRGCIGAQIRFVEVWMKSCWCALVIISSQYTALKDDPSCGQWTLMDIS
ncbi:hypothetical protein M433DRAFT_550084, partial [Acidomyces richmondensis BFW]